MLEKWVELLVFMYKKYEVFGNGGWIGFKNQDVYKSDNFYKIMRNCIKLGWVTEKIESNGCIDKKSYSLTSEGFSAVHNVLVEIFILEKGLRN